MKRWATICVAAVAFAGCSREGGHAGPGGGTDVETTGSPRVSDGAEAGTGGGEGSSERPEERGVGSPTGGENSETLP